MKKAMAFPAIIALVLGAIVIVIAGPIAFQKTKTFINENWSIFEQSGEEDQTTSHTGAGYNTRAVGNRAEVLEQVVSELNTCWLQMKRGEIQQHKCATIDVAYTGEDDIPPPSSFVSSGPSSARGPIHKTEIINALTLRTEDAAIQLNDKWGQADSEALPWLHLERGRYLVCADYDWGDPAGDDIWLTKNLEWECE